ncbi:MULTISPECIES: gluconokinase [Curtobacterium]|uniref:gluconokinase n=1 Tax=Curtobacterium TaxID=2034 RepID=UPI00110E131C|nr:MULTISPECIES: gluconokinase [Curtobacterium]MBT1607762.1 gluconokinase [Curtobacterium flaccumfaciens pv. betae]MBT1658136.1 gluconokinase [Curtobacterium flaccumfaciens pv. betae]MCS0472490.1 gluconokinase [Curtobacterium flaccumfaciens pv. betae]MCS0474603.1 gluconokinase [Curtobacterium flaccumfaciens pv. betae]MCS0479230.1 gluconokinase [Curtobacterium flaccumfaciens pv. betae]
MSGAADLGPAAAAGAADTGLDARVLVVMGVSGSGKSTVAAMVAEQVGWEFAEGDAMHPPANVDKMHAGTPLTDEDRWPWLDVVAGWIRGHLDAGTNGVVTCSALKRSYRDVLRAPGVVFVHVAGDGALIEERMSQRSGHFMPTSLLQSQLATLEPPQPDEAHLTIAADRTPEEESAEVVARLGLVRIPRA